MFHAAAVARPVGKKELEASAKARQSRDKEWKKLWEKKVWDYNGWQEWDKVSGDARNDGRKIHIPRLFGICVEKGSELPADDERRKFKYRVVFQGNQVVTETWEVAIFQDMGSAPATMEAGKRTDAYGISTVLQ